MAEEITFDDRDGFIWLDGALVPWRSANVHVLTHALHYASSVFEGMRAYDGTIFELSRHNRRLRESARLLGFELPWPVEAIDAACIETLAANGLSDAYVRPVAWRGSEQMGVSAARTRPHMAIACWAWGSYFDPDAAGLRLDIAPWRRPPPYCAPVQAKASGHYMIATMSKHHAEGRGFHDALMFDHRGQVAEATAANIFFVRDGTLHTPVADCFLDGITRQTVIGLARRRGIAVVERAIWPEELEGFEQCFLTGSAAEIVGVASIGPWRFETGALTRQIRKDYADLVRGRPASD